MRWFAKIVQQWNMSRQIGWSPAPLHTITNDIGQHAWGLVKDAAGKLGVRWKDITGALSQTDDQIIAWGRTPAGRNFTIKLERTGDCWSDGIQYH